MEIIKIKKIFKDFILFEDVKNNVNKEPSTLELIALSSNSYWKNSPPGLKFLITPGIQKE